MSRRRSLAAAGGLLTLLAACQGPPSAAPDGAPPHPDGTAHDPDGAASSPDGGTPLARLTPLYVTAALPACEMS